MYPSLPGIVTLWGGRNPERRKNTVSQQKYKSALNYLPGSRMLGELKNRLLNLSLFLYILYS